MSGVPEERSKVKSRILIIEDERALREGLAMNFKLHGYEVVTASDGDAGMELAFSVNPDLILLDLMIPGWSGLDILTELRNQSNPVPVLILSARDALLDKIEGLDLGADDYVTKPFELPELLSRVAAMLRRRKVEREAQPELVFDELVIRPGSRRVTIAGSEITLSSKEFDILFLLANSPGRAFSRDAILEKVWGWDFEGTARTVDNFIMNLRKKIESEGGGKHYIVTVRQVGYMFEP